LGRGTKKTISKAKTIEKRVTNSNPEGGKGEYDQKKGVSEEKVKSHVETWGNQEALQKSDPERKI